MTQEETSVEATLEPSTIRAATIELNEGEVACIFPADGDDFAIVHNIPDALANDYVTLETPGAAQLMIALTMRELMESDEQAVVAAMVRVNRKMADGSLRLV